MAQSGEEWPQGSGYRGVVWNRRDKKWVARIGEGGTYKWLGAYDDKKDAAKAWDDAARLQSKVWVTAISSRYPHLFPDLPALLMYTRVTYCLADSCVGRRVLGS